jgi:hypothetical protein
VIVRRISLITCAGERSSTERRPGRVGLVLAALIFGLLIGMMSDSARRLRVRKACEGSLRFRRRRPHPLEGAVDRGPSDAEEFSEVGLGVGAEVVQLEQMLGLVRLQLRLLAAQPAVGFGDLHPLPDPHPDQVGFDSATMASTLNSSRPTGSVGSWIEPPRLSFTLRLVLWTEPKIDRDVTSRVEATGSVATSTATP